MSCRCTVSNVNTQDYNHSYLPPAEDTNNTTNLVIATNNGIKLALFGKSGEVRCVLVQRIEALFGVLAVDTTVAPDLVDGRLHNVLGETGLLEDRCDRRVLDKGGKDVVLGNVGIVHGFPERVGLAKDLGGGRAESDLLRWW